MTSDQRCAMSDGFDLPDLGATHASFEPAADCCVTSVLAAASAFPNPHAELTVFMPESMQDIAADVCYATRTRLRLLPTRAFPNPFAWAISDYKMTITIAPVT